MPEPLPLGDDDNPSVAPASMMMTTPNPPPSLGRVVWRARGAVWIIVITTLVAFGWGSVLGLIPATLTDRYARLNYGYNGTAICRHHHHHHDDDPHSTNQTDPDETPACEQGSRAAESAAATANFVTYGLSMVANPWIGSYSDVHGRRPVLLFALSLSCLPAVMFCLLVHIPTLPPVWYYASTTLLGGVNYFSITFAALADVIPLDHHRTAVYGLLMAAQFGGYSVAPTVAVVVTSASVMAVLSLSLIAAALLLAWVVLPETLGGLDHDDDGGGGDNVDDDHNGQRIMLPLLAHQLDSVSITTDVNMGLDDSDDDYQEEEEEEEEEENDVVVRVGNGTRSHGIVARHNDNEHLVDDDLQPWTSTAACCCRYRKGMAVVRIMVCQARAGIVDYGQRVSILATSTTLVLLSLASFLSSMVHSTDATLIVYYAENNFAVGPKDIAGLFLALGIAGMIIQAGLLSCLLRCLGERLLLVVSFVSGTFHNALYCIARSKRTLYLALIASQLTKTNMPILSSLAGAQVSRLDQGRLQGVLSAVNALASALGPPLFMRWSSRSDSSTDDNSSSNNQTSRVFAYAALVYGIGVVLVMIVATLPAEHQDGDGMNHHDRQRQQPEERATGGVVVESNHRNGNHNNGAADEESSPFVSSTLERPLLLGDE